MARLTASTRRRIRYCSFLISLLAFWVASGRARASEWDECDNFCPTAACADQCFTDPVQFENGNSTTCLDYGVYDTTQFCCGDGVCNGAAGETADTCPADCYTPPPPPPSQTLLINGSFNDTDPAWSQPGSPEFNDIQATYGVPPIPYFWYENQIGEVIWPDYSGIYAGALDLASFVNGLGPGDVNLVAHSHGGNVAIIATNYLGRSIKHFIELGTPVNFDLPRYLGGPSAEYRCTASSWDDWVQFFGSSPPQQVAPWFYAIYQEGVSVDQIVNDLEDGDDTQALIDALEATGWAAVADAFWASAKDELQGETDFFTGLAHSDMHEPIVWDNLDWVCKTGG